MAAWCSRATSAVSAGVIGRMAAMTAASTVNGRGLIPSDDPNGVENGVCNCPMLSRQEVTDGVLEVEAKLHSELPCERHGDRVVGSEGGDGVCERAVEVGIDGGDNAQPVTLLGSISGTA